MKNFIFLLLAAQCSLTTVYGQVTLTDDEKAAIVAVIEQESRCYFSNDYNCWLECWSKDPQISGFVATGGAVYERISWQVMSESAQSDMRNRTAPDPVTIQRKNLGFIVLGDKEVICYFDEYNIREKECNVSKEIRALRKEGGSWKITLMTAMFDSTRKCGG